jgi:hypothetical protein
MFLDRAALIKVQLGRGRGRQAPQYLVGLKLPTLWDRVTISILQIGDRIEQFITAVDALSKRFVLHELRGAVERRLLISGDWQK